MTEWGIFNDEGMVEGGFRSPEEATEAIWDRYDEEDDLSVLEVCPWHEEQPRDTCEECEAE